MDMKNGFYCHKLKNDWFDRNFYDYSLFGFIGDRERLQDAILHNRSLARKVFEILLPRLRISSLLNTITGFDLLKASTDSGVVKELFDLLTKEENRRTVFEQLTALQQKAKMDSRFFQRVSKCELGKATALPAPGKLEDKLITVEGQLIHRDSVQQHSRTFDATLRASKHEWILCDFPPHALNEQNESFTGNGLLLLEDTGFSKAFADYLPFNKEVGWYPYVRVTGFYSAAKLNTEKLPSLSISLVEFKPPKKFLEIRSELLAFINSENEQPYWLKSWSESLLFSYLPPITFAGSNLTPKDVDIPFASTLRAYASKIGSDIPSSLINFYKALPSCETDS